MTTEDTFIRDVSDLMEIQEDSNLWNNESATAHSMNKHITLLLFKDGDRYNFLRIIDRADAASPTSGAMSAASMYVPLDDAAAAAAAAAATTTTTNAMESSDPATAAAAAAAAATALEEGLTDILKSMRHSKLISAHSSSSRRRKSAARETVTVSENRRTKEKMNAIKNRMSQRRAQLAAAAVNTQTHPVGVGGVDSLVNHKLGVDSNVSKPSVSNGQIVRGSDNLTTTANVGVVNEEPQFTDEYYDDDDESDEDDEEDPDEEDEDEYVEEDDDCEDCEDDYDEEVDDDDEYDEDDDDYDDDDTEQENSDEDLE